MKFILTLILIAALAYFYWNSSYNVSPTIQNVNSGVLSYGKETMDSLKANGLVSLDQTTVRGRLEVNGSVKATKAIMGAFDCAGYASLTDCLIKTHSDVSGFLNATRTAFQGPVVLKAQNATFTDCTIESLIVKNPTWVFGTQVIELQGKTIVKGSITFESGHGKVNMSPQSKVLGKIVGGQ